MLKRHMLMRCLQKPVQSARLGLFNKGLRDVV